MVPILSTTRKMLVNTNLICSSLSSFPLQLQNHTPKIPSRKRTNSKATSSIPTFNSKSSNSYAVELLPLQKFEKGPRLQLSRLCCYSSLNTEENPENTFLDNGISSKEEEDSGGNGSGGGEGRDWTTSFLLFVLYAGLMYYVVFLAPNQTPSTDSYFVKKLLNVIGDDGFKMNEVLVALWYIMGLYPFVYSMLLLPTGRSGKSSVPVWPFLILSGFLGAYALIPYFILWRPPPPPIEETELSRWPLNFLESKLTAGITLAAGLGLMAYAGLSNADIWKEFYQYFRASRLVHLTCLDFALLSAFAPFWVYNDMTARGWDNKGSWLLPLSLVPFLGPALYLLLRPSLSVLTLISPSTSEEK